MSARDEMLRHANAINIDNLPPNYNHLMLRELLANFPGVEDAQHNAEKLSAYVRFRTTDEAKLALSGKALYALSVNTCNRTQSFQNR
jgi:hypothetical protein